MSRGRRWFGPGMNEVWADLAAQLGGEVVDKGRWQGSKVVAPADLWRVVFDTFSQSTGQSSITYTRVRAPFVSRDGFRFKVYRSGFFSELGKRWFRLQDIEVWFQDFDRDFIIQATDEAKVRWLFQNGKIRRLIQEQPGIRLEVLDDEGRWGSRYPREVDLLRFQVTGTIKDAARLRSLHDLFGEVLAQLVRMGSAAQEAPPLAL